MNMYNHYRHWQRLANTILANTMAMLLMAALLSSCTSTNKTGLVPVVIAQNITLHLLAPAASQPPFVETQLVKASFDQIEHELLVQIESTTDQITLVALTATGTRLASVSLNSEGIKSDALSILPAQFDVAQLLAAYQLSTRAINQLQANIVSNAFELKQENNKRLLLQQGKAIIEISFGLNAQQQPTILYQHNQWDYKIHITTLSKQPL